MKPGQEENQFFCIDLLLEDTFGKLYLVVKSISDYTYYDQHYQAYVIENGYDSKPDNWLCLNLHDLELSTVSYVTKNGEGNLYFPKRWI